MAMLNNQRVYMYIYIYIFVEGAPASSILVSHNSIWVVWFDIMGGSPPVCEFWFEST